MEAKTTVNGAITLIEIQKDGKPVSPQNGVSVGELEDFANSVEVSGGEVAFLSGMPQWAIAALALKVKNLFSAVGVYDPKQGVIIVHSTSSKYKVGQILPLN